MNVRKRLKRHNAKRMWARFWENMEGDYQVKSYEVYIYNTPNYIIPTRSRKYILIKNRLVITDKGKQHNMENILSGEDVLPEDYYYAITANLRYK